MSSKDLISRRDRQCQENSINFPDIFIEYKPLRWLILFCTRLCI